MRRPLIAMLVSLVAWGGSASGLATEREIDNVAAFARLYGVARYFYPGDVAADLDWDAFAIHGVKQARPAADATRLMTTLKDLFGPLGLGIQIAATLPARPSEGSADPALIAWRYLGAGVVPSGRPPYAGRRTHRASSPTIDGFVTLMQTVPADSLRGKTIRLRGRVRAKSADGAGSAALWLRVDRADQRGFFDNMGDRPVRDPEWREYAIEGPVAEDATVVAFGAMASGRIDADFDAIDLAVRGGDGNWTPIPIIDGGFELAPGVPTRGWARAGNSTGARITWPGEQPPEGRQFVRFSAAQGADTELIPEAVPVTGASVDVDLGSGLKARVPLALSDAEARGSAQQAGSLNELRSAMAGARAPIDPPDTDVRLADVVVAWNVFRHFYPYWTEAGVDWDARLRPQLEDAHAATTRGAQRDALRRLVADARDGHGYVGDARVVQPRALLPIRLGRIGDRVVVTASEPSSDVAVGAVVSAIDGVGAAERLDAEMRLASGSTQWREARALQEMTTCPRGSVIALVLDSGKGPKESRLRCEATRPAAEKRPEPIAELVPGIWYVDLTRARAADVTPVIDKLANAAGVVFDVRGYPTDAGREVLLHLIDAPEADRWMHVAKITGPFGQSAGWLSVGWNMQPKSPRLAGKIVFMTDGQAISYAESVMGYVADRKLGTIIGGTTAGTNGNIVTFVVPGGFNITFTGLRVTGHDGRTPYHLAGVKPDLAVVPTVDGLRQGRDEVLDRAVAVVRAK